MRLLGKVLALNWESFFGTSKVRYWQLLQNSFPLNMFFEKLRLQPLDGVLKFVVIVCSIMFSTNQIVRSQSIAGKRSLTWEFLLPQYLTRLFLQLRNVSPSVLSRVRRNCNKVVDCLASLAFSYHEFVWLEEVPPHVVN